MGSMFLTRWEREFREYRTDRRSRKENQDGGIGRLAVTWRPWSSLGGNKAGPWWPPSPGPHPTHSTVHHQSTQCPGLGGPTRVLRKGCPDPLPLPPWPTPSSHLRKDLKWGSSAQPPRTPKSSDHRSRGKMFAINERPKWSQSSSLRSSRNQSEEAVPWIGPPWLSGASFPALHGQTPPPPREMMFAQMEGDLSTSRTHLRPQFPLKDLSGFKWPRGRVR